MARTLFFIFLIVSSCSIIEDGDITSAEELANLKLESIDLTIEASGGTNSLQATVTSESHTEIAVPGGTINRQVYMNWPALNSKIKLRSGYTQAFRSYTSYLSNGKPYTFYLFDATSDSTLLELYRFRYDAQGRLSLIVTLAPFVEGAPATSRDSLVYNVSNRPREIGHIIRGSSDPSKVGTMNIQGGSFAGDMFTFVFRNTTYAMSCQGSGCGQYWGGDHYTIPGTSSGGFPTGVMNVNISRAEFYIQDINKDVSGYCGTQGCKQGNDTYYLHPLMVLKDQFESGEALFFIYQIDWWQPTSAQESTTNEKVTFSFNYDY